MNNAARARASLDPTMPSPERLREQLWMLWHRSACGGEAASLRSHQDRATGSRPEIRLRMLVCIKVLEATEGKSGLYIGWFSSSSKLVPNAFLSSEFGDLCDGDLNGLNGSSDAPATSLVYFPEV
eukprot:CAMPEP_0174704634 /NCGR_PEP_ID=MMETSP1094-20130205/8154_1 /TAXON_ID=156173 /ORGANISM="Chrysochromulina brevifilum, Strain UTEX LB 985" /LENGTH=124 /DNA_ID=CAMNT_0015902713 /DNA_START=603 /DNA_END=977 /DNA_ORIENTATION=+